MLYIGPLITLWFLLALPLLPYFQYNSYMADVLLQTKLFVPPQRSSLVPRPLLIEKLKQGWQQGSKLFLVSAPAGFGKTTLVREWIDESERPFAWLSLDERDSDSTRFLLYFIAALQTIKPSLGQRAAETLKSPQIPSPESLLTTLLNEMAAIPEEFVLVLDDYHLVDAQLVDQALTFLLEHLPPRMHLVITTREDPALPLARLRVRGQMTELRATDLRFTLDEASGFLNQVMGLNLSAEEIAALETRTEGWIAGLQMAALSIQGRADTAGFIQAFTGSHRFVLDYLVEEVLQNQPDRVRSFLLETSILNRLMGSLCDALTEQKDGTQMLEALERGNLFVVPLDDKRHWYRYHHLFADVLQAHLMKEQPEEVALLHQRASIWYEQNEFTADAVHHALEARDFDRAAGIIELAWAEMDRSRQSSTWLAWAKKLPDDLLRTRPVITVGCAWALLDIGELEAAMARLQEAEQCLKTPANMVVVDKVEFQVLPGTIASAHTYYALAFDDMVSTIKHAQQALDLFPEDAYLRRGTPAALLGLASWASGDLVAALHAFTEAMNSYQKAGNILFVITGAYVLADMKLAQGQLRQTFKIYEDALQLAQAHGEPVIRGAADLYTGLSELSLEQNDLTTAKEYLRRSKESGETAALPRWRYRWCLAQAKIKAAEGNLDKALDSLNEAEQHYVRGPVPDVRTTAALKARLWVAQGRLVEAMRWGDTQGLTIDDDLAYLCEFDHITLVRILIAQQRRDQEEGRLQKAFAFLERLRQVAEADDRMGSVLEILVLQALAHEAAGSTTAALVPLARALALAEPEGYVRLFVGEGPPMQKLLTTAVAQSIKPAYASKLLAAFTVEKQENTNESDLPRATHSAAQPLVEPLSERELEVLHLVAQGLSNQEIAERLFLALPTVKGHNRNIYSKLQVRRRTEAVSRARELGIL